MLTNETSPKFPSKSFLTIYHLQIIFQAKQQNSSFFALQPNVMKKSWTTANIASAIEEDTRNYTQEEAAMFQSRDLIREYLLKTRVPEILKLSQSRPQSSTYATSEMNFAYKHPLVLGEELKSGSGEGFADGKLCNEVDNSSIIIPKTVKHRQKLTSDERPHLIGKVTPSIAKTWEQLSNAMDSSIESHQEDDKQSYVLFVRKPFNFQSNDDETFAVNKIQHEPSEKFYDSIDETQYAEDYEEEEEEDESCTGREEMAGTLDSLELRCNDVILWSIES